MSELVSRRRHKRPRPQSSCSTCHRRKVKCDKNQPCEPCIRHGCAEECRFDGVPAKRVAAPSSTSLRTRNPASPNERTDRAFDEMRGIDHSGGGGFPTPPIETPDSDTRSQLRSLLLLNQTFAQPKNAPPTTGSGLPTHDWLPNSGLARGRTHTSWLLPTFAPIMIYAGRHTANAKQLQDDDPHAIRDTELMRMILPLDSESTPTASSVYDELVRMSPSRDLVLRYFDTFDTIYPFIDRETFGRDFIAMIADFGSVPAQFAIKVLLMQALANATYPLNEAPLYSCTVSRWLGLAASFLSSVLSLGILDVEVVRMSALIALAEQVLKEDATAAYVSSGACIRSAMALGLHRVEEMPALNYETARCLWEALVDLDLHACLAAGLPPNMPLAGEFEQDVPILDNASMPAADLIADFQPEQAPLILSQSLPIRQKIVTILNTTKHLHFETVVKLSTELSKSMAPITRAAEKPTEHNDTFQFRFLSFVYGRFLAALHRPSSMIDHPALFPSRNMTVRLSKQYVKELTAVYEGHANSDPFANLLVSQGVMFKTEATQAVMALCHELYQQGESGFGAQTASVLLRHGDERKDGRNVMRKFLGVVKDKVKTKEISEEVFWISKMILAHLDAAEKFRRETVGYVRAMVHAGTEAA